jgi:hypothetical protein
MKNIIIGKPILSAKQDASTNPSGCCCEFADDGETIIKPCKAHLNWKKDESTDWILGTDTGTESGTL